MSDDPKTDLKFPHDHIRIQGCYQCVLPEGVTDLAVVAHAALQRARTALADTEHRLRLLADMTYDYGPEGMRTRLIREYQIIAAAMSGEDQKETLCDGCSEPNRCGCQRGATFRPGSEDGE